MQDSFNRETFEDLFRENWTPQNFPASYTVNA